MKFLADMGISPKTVQFLRDRNHDAIHLVEEGLERLDDPAILEKARAEGRIVLAHDLDFPDLLAAGGEQLPSVIVFRLRNMRPENVNEYLERALADHVDELQKGAILTITEGRVRARRLPLR